MTHVNNTEMIKNNRPHIEIMLSELPRYLKNSVLYRHMLEISSNIDEYIPIDPKFYVTSITDYESFGNFIETLRFWQVDEYPIGIILNYVNNNRDIININDLRERFHDLNEIIDSINMILDN